MDSRPQRSFSIGSEWLYYKLYTGHKTADFILTEIIKPITSELKVQGMIDKWFFIRYADPKHHLRVRFRSTEGNNLGGIISALHKPLGQLVQQGLIWKIQLDTYQRELERYGTGSMELSETLFYYDSEAIIRFLDLIEGDEGEQLRWLFGLRSIDHLLSIFDYTLERKLGLLNNLKTGFGQEFGMSRPLKKQLDGKFREERENIEHFLSFIEKDEPDYVPLLEILEEKKKLMRPIAIDILNLKKEDSLKMDLNHLMGSYIHMLMNRLFKSKNRLNEMVCYDFLYRYYRSSISRK